MQAISLDVILQAVLGLGDPTSRGDFKEAVLSMIAALKPSFMFFPALRRPSAGVERVGAIWSARKAAAAALFEKELAARRARPDVGEDILNLAGRLAQGGPGPPFGTTMSFSSRWSL